jgi:hypothetical protein
MQDGELVTSRPRSTESEHYMLYDGKHQKYAMVDEETFKAANADFKKDRTKSGLKLANMFAGLIVCKKCGKKMTYQSYKHLGGKVAPRILHQDSQLCKVKSVIASDLLNAVKHSLKLYIEDFEMKIDNLPDVDEKSIEMQIEVLRTEQRKIEKKLAKLFDAWEDDKITDNDFVQRKAVNNSRIETIQKQMVELENSVPEKEEYQERIMHLTNALDALLDETLEAEIKNEYLKLIIDKIEFSRENDNEFIIDVFLK